MHILTNLITLNKNGKKYTILYKSLMVVSNMTYVNLTDIIKVQSTKKTGPYKHFVGKLSLINRRFDPEVGIEILRYHMRKEIVKFEEVEGKEKPIIVKSWSEFSRLLNQCVQQRDDDYKFMLSVIISYKYLKDDSDFCNYFLMLAPKSKGKSFLQNSFVGCEDVQCLDNMTMEAWAPGSVDGTKIMGICDMVKDKTLMIHDVSSLFGSNPDKVKKVLSDFEQSFGMEPFRKGMPGAIQKFGGGWNGIFGIPPMLFMNNRVSFLQTSRFFVYQLSPIDERRIILEGRNHPDKKTIRRLCKGFLNHLQKNIINVIIPLEVRTYMVDFLEVYVQWLKVYKGVYHEWESEGMLRRFGQVEALVKARCCVEGRTDANLEDAKYFLDMLWFGDSKAQIRKKLALAFEDEEDYAEFLL